MFSLVVGFTGSIISLLISQADGEVVDRRAGDRARRSTADERGWSTRCSGSPQTAGIGMPEVAVYEGAPNAFATGAFKNSALVAVSTGPAADDDREEVEAVLGHEVAHVANGDMVTLTLIQGVVNTFVVFLVARRRLRRRHAPCSATTSAAPAPATTSP